MSQPDNSLIGDVRTASRDLVRQFGLMNKTVAGTGLTLSAVHAIIEIGHAGELSSRQLSTRLQLEKSTVSRLVKSLLQRELIQELRCKQDLRVKRLRLTRHGRQSLQDIDRFAEAQVSCALQRLKTDSRLGVLRGLQDYSQALSGVAAVQQAAAQASKFTIETGYTPAIIARSVEMLHLYMNRHFDFGASFESRIAGDLAEFMTRIDSPDNASWRAQHGDNIVGVISIDGEDLVAHMGKGCAHLRWFVVSDSMRGSGIGNALLSQALEFCDQRGFRETHLWTVHGLDAARRLYERHGFRLAEEYLGDQWGREILEQRFVRQLQQ
jgi:DNA-binding MarR family transcriptional regulator/GNAT superfamily N-acetyltransferase